MSQIVCFEPLQGCDFPFLSSGPRSENQGGGLGVLGHPAPLVNFPSQSTLPGLTNRGLCKRCSLMASKHMDGDVLLGQTPTAWPGLDLWDR